MEEEIKTPQEMNEGYENVEEEIEVETIETEMTNEDIDELISKLCQLKESKGQMQHELAEDTELVINHVPDQETGEEL